MSHRERRNPTFRSLRFVALAAALGLCAVMLSQCRMVQDNVTGLSLQAGTLDGRSSCVHQCNDAYEAAQRAEEARHRAAVRKCGCDRKCDQAEDYLHHVNNDKIDDARKACKKGCYNEGGGHSDR